MEIKKYVLDFSECNYPAEVHEILQKKLGLPEWYGKNYDALWDSITGVMYLPAHVTIRKSESKKLETMMATILGIFQEAKDGGYIEVEIE